MYGIPNCNTVKKARVYLEEEGVNYEFIDFKKTPPTQTDIQRWKKVFGDWPVNKRGPTYRKIKEEFEAGDSKKKYKILIEHTSAIKRPIVEKKTKPISFGFDEELFAKIF